MSIDTKNVVIIKDDVVYAIYSFPNTDEGNINAEQCFVEQLSDLVSNFDEYTQADISNILDNGYEMYGNGSICIAASN